MTNDIRKVIEKWTNSQEVLLRMGEMTPQEKRSVMAALNGMAREIENILDKYAQSSIGVSNLLDGGHHPR